jgi:hypothetical protein
VNSLTSLAQSLRAWVDAGLITPDQADAISRYETSGGAGAEAAKPFAAQDSRAALVVEVLGYLGGALALAAVAFIVAQMW